MTITELKNKGLIPTILSELYDDNSIKHWWMIADRRKDSERLYIGCKYPVSSRKSFDTFEDCIMDLKLNNFLELPLKWERNYLIFIHNLL